MDEYYFFVPDRLVWDNWKFSKCSFEEELEEENYLDWLEDIKLYEVGASYES